MTSKGERCGTATYHARFCDLCWKELWGTGPCDLCGGRGAAFVGLDVPDMEYVCDACNDDMMRI